MGRTIGIITPLLLLGARPSYMRMAILEGCGRPEVLTDGILVLPWTIILAVCTTFRKHLLTVFLAQWGSFPSVANCPTCPPTNIYVPSLTNYLIWPAGKHHPQRQTFIALDTNTCACTSPSSSCYTGKTKGGQTHQRTQSTTENYQ
jgi:hypothetical protein